MATKALTSFAGVFLGDRIAQGFGGAAYDPYRCGQRSALARQASGSAAL